MTDLETRPAPTRKKAATQAITPIQRRLLDARMDIQGEPLEQMDYLHTVLCQVGMPRRQTEERAFERINGHMMMRLDAGVLFDGHKSVPQPLPYGARPRLIMVHVCSEAVRKQSPVVEIGHSAHHFMKSLGFDTNGDSYSQTRKQMLALAACRLTLGYNVNGRPTTINTQPVRRFEAWLSKEDNQRVLWPGVIELSTDFYESLADHAVPLDHTALAALCHSALALDIYTWLAHRLCRITRATGVKVSWANLREQFGQEYADPRNFKRELRQAIRQALAVYPDARVEEVPGGLMLKPSHPPIAKASVLLSAATPSQ